MRRMFMFFTLFVVAVVWVGCGNDSHIVPSQTQGVAILSEVAGTGTLQIQILKTDGTANPVGNPDYYQAVSLSPDGKKIAFALDLPSASAAGRLAAADYTGYQVGVMNSDGTGYAILSSDTTGGSYEPAFSPDGTKILYRSYEQGDADLMIANTDGTRTANLTNQNGWCYHSPSFSPDGTEIVAEVHGYDAQDNYVDGIAVVNSDGSNTTLITTTDESYPSFSSDGAKVAYTVWGSTGPDIYIANTDGSNPTNLTNSQLDWDGVFVGNKIIFASMRAGTSTGPVSSEMEIYGMNADGTGVTRITNNSVYDGFTDDYFGSGIGGIKPAFGNRVRKGLPMRDAK